MTESFQKDLIVLVADKDIESAVGGLLSRRPSLNIRQPDYKPIAVHPRRDPGCFNESPNFLNPFIRTHRRALVVFDRDGCGKETRLSREEIEQNVEQRLSVSGWNDRCAVVVLDPEIEIWVWSDSPHVDRILGWQNQQQNLKDWLISRGHLQSGQIKPSDPKDAFEDALRKSQTPKSSGIFQELAKSVSLDRCVDPAFQKLRDVLRNWFPSP
jgi:hypothetical protein